MIKSDNAAVSHGAKTRSLAGLRLSAWFCLIAFILAIWTVWLYFSDDILTSVVSFLDWGTAWVQKLELLPEREAILPLFCMCLSIGVTLCLKNRSSWARLFIALAVLSLGLRYLVWRFFNAFDLDTDVNFYLRMLCLTVELFVYTNSLLFFLQTALPTNRSKEADHAEKAVLSGEYVPSVDIFVPTYNEDVDMLRRTVIGCQSIDYPNKIIYLLDDTRREHVRKLAEELGCHYVDRRDNKGAKAGNMNNALFNFAKSELVAVFDADFVPSKNFLNRTVGFFQDEKTALVQTPQVFYNPDIVQRNLGMEKYIPHEEDLFFRVIQAGRDFWNASICHGTSFVVRRSALDEIGGFPAETITEDFFTSIKLQCLGYRLKYLNEALSAGDSAANTDNYVSQRLRWAQGTFQVLFTPTNPILAPGLNLMQRIIHFSSILYWTMGSCNFLLLLLPLLFLYFDFSPMRCSVLDCVQFWLPYYFFTAVAFTWFVQSRRSFLWSDIYGPLLAVPLATTLVKTLINPFGKGFRVTQKSLGDCRLEISWRLILPLAAFLLLYVVGLARYLFIAPLIYDPETAPMMMIWSIYNVLLLFISIQLCINIKQRRKSIRVVCNVQAQLKIDGQTVPVTVVDLAEGGARIRLRARDVKLYILSGNNLSLVIPALSIDDLPIEHIRIATHEGNELSLAFPNVCLADRRTLVQLIYCKPGGWQDKFVSEWRAIGSLVMSVLRLYPFIYQRHIAPSVAVSTVLEGANSRSASNQLDALTHSV